VKVLAFLLMTLALSGAAVADERDSNRGYDRERDYDRSRHYHRDRYHNPRYEPSPGPKVGEADPYAPKVGAPNPYATQGGQINPYATQGGTPPRDLNQRAPRYR
jgi:hypothetical protein